MQEEVINLQKENQEHRDRLNQAMLRTSGQQARTTIH
jgi:hypothetical protein